MKRHLALALTLAWIGASVVSRRATAQHEPILDIRGLAWLEEDAFVVVHDAKWPAEAERPRLSTAQLPMDEAGGEWTRIDFEFAGDVRPPHDHTGRIFIASTTDPGDDGPFSSTVWNVGRVRNEGPLADRIELLGVPVRIASIDGLKVEAIALQDTTGAHPAIVVGTDDDRYGGVLRVLPPLPP